MPPLNHRINEGANITGTIEGKKISIDVIVRSIRGKTGNKTAIVEIRGIPGKDRIYLKQSEGLVELTDGIKIEMPKSIRGRGVVAPIYYHLSDNYNITTGSYELNY